MLRGGPCVACMSGRTIPDASDDGSSDDPEQASGAVLTGKYRGREPVAYAKVLETEPRALPSATIDHVRS